MPRYLFVGLALFIVGCFGPKITKTGDANTDAAQQAALDWMKLLSDFKGTKVSEASAYPFYMTGKQCKPFLDAASLADSINSEKRPERSKAVISSVRPVAAEAVKESRYFLTGEPCDEPTQALIKSLTNEQTRYVVIEIGERGQPPNSLLVRVSQVDGAWKVSGLALIRK